MKIKLIIILSIITILMLGVPALANAAIKSKFTTAYDNSDSKLDVCNTCMSSFSPPVSLNSFGTDLRNDPAFDRNNPVKALENIEQLDSDGDGFSNIEEINHSTFPGDPDDFPALSSPTVTSTETAAGEVTATVEPTSIEPATTETEQTNSIMNAFATLTVILTITFLKRKKM